MSIRVVACLCLLASVRCSSQNQNWALKKNIPQAIVSIDFSSTYPHKFWISSWSKDEQYPKGFRYKLFAVRNNNEGMIELVLALEAPGGLKDEMIRLKVSPSAADRLCQIFIAGLSEEYGIAFDELDLSDIRSSDTFEQRVTEAGWYEWQP